VTHSARPARPRGPARPRSPDRPRRPDRPRSPDRPRRPAGPGDSAAPAQPGPGGSRTGSGRGSWPGTVTYLAVLAGVGLGLLWMRGGQQHVRSGTLVVAGVLLAGAAARLALPDARTGFIGSRRRLADAAAFAVLGAGLLVAGLVFPVPA
jgi:hypothetical protein